MLLFDHVGKPKTSLAMTKTSFVFASARLVLTNTTEILDTASEGETYFLT
jgi:hypothetical protein